MTTTAQQTAALQAQGLSSTQIAGQLALDPKTVRYHLTRSGWKCASCRIPLHPVPIMEAGVYLCGGCGCRWEVGLNQNGGT